jgi:hypothetical protein
MVKALLLLIALVMSVHAHAEQPREEMWTDCYYKEHDCKGKVRLFSWSDGRGRILDIKMDDEGNGWVRRPLIRMDDEPQRFEVVKIHGPGGRDYQQPYQSFVEAIGNMGPAVYRDDVWIDGVLPENWIDPNQ